MDARTSLVLVNAPKELSFFYRLNGKKASYDDHSPDVLIRTMSVPHFLTYNLYSEIMKKGSKASATLENTWKNNRPFKKIANAIKEFYKEKLRFDAHYYFGVEEISPEFIKEKTLLEEKIAKAKEKKDVFLVRQLKDVRKELNKNHNLKGRATNNIVNYTRLMDESDIITKDCEKLVNEGENILKDHRSFAKQVDAYFKGQESLDEVSSYSFNKILDDLNINSYVLNKIIRHFDHSREGKILIGSKTVYEPEYKKLLGQVAKKSGLSKDKIDEKVRNYIKLRSVEEMRGEIGEPKLYLGAKLDEKPKRSSKKMSSRTIKIYHRGLPVEIEQVRDTFQEKTRENGQTISLETPNYSADCGIEVPKRIPSVVLTGDLQTIYSVKECINSEIIVNIITPRVKTYEGGIETGFS